MGLAAMVLSGNDREVIEACQRGDHEAFALLFETNKDRVYSIALRYCGDKTAAMDLAQDIFLKLLARIKDFRGESSFETWLFRLVVNSCLDYQRRRRKLVPLVEDFLAVFRSPRETVLTDLLRGEMREQVQEGVGKLPPEQRIVVVLRYTEGMSYQEIAEVLGCSTGTVASRLNRAHKTLERRLAPLREGDGRAYNG